jgi:hypothetical protein
MIAILTFTARGLFKTPESMVMKKRKKKPEFGFKS